MISRRKRGATVEVSKKNRYIIAVSALLVALLLIFAFLRDRSHLIDARTAQNLIDNSLVEDAKIEGAYLYFKSGREYYKVPKDAIDLKELYSTTAVAVKEPNPYMADLITAGFLALLVFYILRWARKNRELKEQQLSEQIQFANDFKDRVI